MLNIDSLEKGVVIDHIESGRSMEIYRVLELDKLDCSVAIIKNARSKKSGRKDIIKIEDRIDIDLDVLGFIDPNITVNIIDGGRIIEKKHLQLPERIVNVAKCKNPRCITSVEQELDHVFVLTDAEKGVYRCLYCEQEYKRG
ncbi:MAG TPA: aspartate carbamoyltransferase regulatory subunit [Candidatus Fournierella merdipullorum]|uniref:Aspartate carbamoyltransferase regulatory subunit n=1 Tax=Candidatus Allofournierella merdipullorum TaxID=2838595 RepID=A0A9D2IYN1_9FIRM|nr:aspartate carbamoyltransferase regulatory subunit [Candidatus Fournierella merdipullorum]HIZ30111.1 aspartate carbamoyltransferase regulatory subunit [Candidatus Fournierella merdipullorum]